MRRKALRRAVREPVAGVLVQGLRGLIGLLPYRVLPVLARLGGGLARRLPGVRDLILANLAVAFPDQSPAAREGLLRGCCCHLCLTFLEFYWFSVHPRRLLGLVEVTPEAMAALQRARAGAGTMFMSPHLGNWELSGQLVAALGIPFAAVASPLKSRAVDRMVTRVRLQHGMRLIPEQGAARGIVQAARAGCCIGVLMDQNTSPRKGGTFVPFFGLPAATSRAPAALARRLGLEIMVGAVVRENGHLCLRVGQLPKPAAACADDVELTRDLMAANEQLIRRWPEQYLWKYRRWRYIPDNATAEERRRLPAYARPVD